MRVSNLTKRFSAFLLTLAVSASIVATNVKAEGFSAQELTKTTSFTVGNKAKDVNIENSIKVNKANLNKDERGIYIDWEIISNVNSEGGGVYAPLVSPKGWNNHNWHSILLPNSLKDPENLKINGEKPKGPATAFSYDINWENAYKFRKQGEKDFDNDIERFFTKGSGSKSGELNTLAKNSRYMIYATNLVGRTKGKPVKWTFRTYIQESFLKDAQKNSVKLAISYAEKAGGERTRVKVVEVKIKNVIDFNKNTTKFGDKEQQHEKISVLAGQSIANSTETNAKISDKSLKNYNFEGWNTNADGSGTKFTKDTKITKDMEVFGKWKPLDVFEIEDGQVIPKTHAKVTFKLGEGVKKGKVKTYAVKKGTVLEQKYFPNVELEEGYKDLKWTPEKNTVIEKDTVFVASATKKESNSNPNGGNNKSNGENGKSNDKNEMLKPEVGKESRKAKLPKTAVATGSLAMALVSLVGLGLIKKRK